MINSNHPVPSKLEEKLRCTGGVQSRGAQHHEGLRPNHRPVEFFPSLTIYHHFTITLVPFAVHHVPPFLTMKKNTKPIKRQKTQSEETE